MKPSQLIPIIRRLDAMREDESDEIQVRRFEKDGKEQCIVRYDKSSRMYELEDRTSGQTYEFDNIDYVAVEILELVQPASSTED
ncbi:YkuJ family protein [Marinilactibacillus psychrotolerans]|uniref:DUF1797 family protein n=2 Tax=Marinilactibacillus psychrotolerans TaxID=191770 RepID=A0A5R9C4A6_9LACT|nr:YkuJ family protein [Marinilactibacillus psychrotolerans]TLQ07696.1 DUF1797 family protein [Marinilactibacillus psychrotolerans]GEQ33111.1 hypothetical protein B795N_09930 [Marinilactibacillus psychrotolerans]SJN21580.1 hypothetical protein FM115_01965 [Marinilactibacillus psychrotolerans 42ea]